MRPFNKNDHNVYVLGAGFSTAAGIPVVHGFLNATRDCQDWLREKKRDTEAGAIEEILQFRLDAASAAERMHVDLENIEELFSLASASQGDRLTQSMIRAIAATIEYSQEAAVKCRESWDTRDTRPLRILAGSSGSPRPHWTSTGSVPVRATTADRFDVPLYDMMLGVMCSYFRRGLASTNTIVTFNYDLLVEAALQRLGLSYSYGFSERAVEYKADEANGHCGETEVLKLHGSINWAFHSQVGQGLTVFTDPSDLRNQGLIPYLVPPSWKKTFGDALNGVWDSAVNAIAHATRIVIIGYSMPTTDTHFKYLLAAGLQRNASLRSLIVIDNNPDAGVVAGRLFQTVRKELEDRGLVRLFKKQAADVWDDEGVRRALNREVLPPFVRRNE